MFDEVGRIFIQILILFCLMAVGYAAKKLRLMDDAFDQKLSKLVLDVALPAWILGSVLVADELPAQESILEAFGLACLCYIALIAIAFITTAVLRIRPGHQGVYRFMCVFGNVGFIGFPVLSAIFGPGALIYACIFNVPFNLLVFTVGVWFLAHDNDAGAKVKVGLRSFLTPTIFACLFATVLALFGVHSLPFVGDAFNALGAMTTPAALLIVGSSLANMPMRDLLGTPWLWACSLVRLVIAPLVVWLLFGLFVGDGMMLSILTVLAAMPVAMNGTMLCYEYGGDAKTMAQGICISTLVSLITIPILVMLVG